MFRGRLQRQGARHSDLPYLEPIRSEWRPGWVGLAGYQKAETEVTQEVSGVQDFQLSRKAAWKYLHVPYLTDRQGYLVRYPLGLQALFEWPLGRLQTPLENGGGHDHVVLGLVVDRVLGGSAVFAWTALPVCRHPLNPV